MKLEEITQKPIGILKNSPISDVMKKLLENNFSRLVVLEGTRPVGIISEKDVGLFLFNESTPSGLDQVPLEKIMHQIEYVPEEKSAEECAKIMMDKKISSLMIGNDDNGRIFTKTDLVKYYSENYTGKNKVVDYMTHDYVYTYGSAPLFKVVRKMLEEKISRIIIKNQEKKPVGVVSFRDFFKISLELGTDFDSGYGLLDNIRTGFLSEDGFGGSSQAREVMSSGVVTIKFDEDLAIACGTMLEENVSALAVLDGNGSIQGIISKSDVTKALTAS